MVPFITFMLCDSVARNEGNVVDYVELVLKSNQVSSIKKLAQSKGRWGMGRRGDGRRKSR